MEHVREWAENEFGSADLGDRRRTRRLVKLATSFAEKPGGTVTSVVRGSAEREGAFRLVENDAIEPAAIGEGHHRATARRCADHDEVIVPIDQSTLSLTDTVGKTGFGRVASVDSKRTRGLQAMSALALTPAGVVLGTLALHWWARLTKSPEWNRDKRPAHERESDLWRRTLLSAHAGLRELAAHTTAWFQLDRGGDTAVVLGLIRDLGLKATVRSAHNRRLKGGGRLRKRVGRSPVAGHIRLTLPSRPKGRKPILSVRFATVRIALRHGRREAGVVELQCVHLREARPRSGAKRLEWWLLTSAPVHTLAQAIDVAQNYRLRWRIEELHRAWKSGVCRIEDSQLRSARAFQRWATLALAVAARAEHLKTASRANPDAPATTQLSRAEIDAAIVLSETKRHRPGQDLTLHEAVDLIARIGGYIGKSSGGPPGVRTIQRGFDLVGAAARVIEALAKK